MTRGTRRCPCEGAIPYPGCCGRLLDTDGTVEFRAHRVTAGRPGAQHEISRFVREGGRWRYLDGVSPA